MEEEKTAGAQAPHESGCLLCTVLPMLERRWSEATQNHFRNSRVEFLKGLRALLDDRIEHLSHE